jgi:hypothetical protein
MSEIKGLFDNRLLQEKLLARCIPEPNSGCWIWLGGTKGKPGNAYGSLYWDKKYHSAHRLSFATFRGEIPIKMNVCHHCDNTFCINPDHIFLGTQKDNIKDMHSKRRSVSKGELHHRWKGAVLTDKIVLEIRKSTKATRQFARELGVSRTAIKLARSGKTWGHLNGMVR